MYVLQESCTDVVVLDTSMLHAGLGGLDLQMKLNVMHVSDERARFG